MEIAHITLDLDLPDNGGVENNIYNMMINLKWATDYFDIYKELDNQNLGYLIKKPN